MKIGILSDTHNERDRTRRAVEMLVQQGAELLVHCGDLSGPEIVRECSVLPFYFTFGNHDADTVPYLREAAEEHGATCLEWGGEFEVAGKRIAVVHGHLTSDLRPLVDARPDYLLYGHFHVPLDANEVPTRRINPGALYRAEEYTVAILDIVANELRFLSIPE